MAQQAKIRAASDNAGRASSRMGFKRFYALLVVGLALLVAWCGLNANALRRWRYARMTTGQLLSAAQREPEKLDLVDVAGTRLLQDGRAAEANDLLVPIATKHPEDAELDLLAGRAAWRTGHPQQAGQLLYAALQADPASADACYWSALFIAERGNKTKAEALLMQALRLDPQRGAAWSALGEIAYNRPDYPTALERFNHAEQLTPTEAVALLRAKTLKAMGRYNEAEAAARQAVARGSLAQDYTILGEVVQLSPDPARLHEAQGYLREAIKRDPHNLDALNLLGVNYRRAGDYKQAIKVLRRMLRQQPALTEGYLLLSQSYRATGQATLAAQCFRIYAHLEPLQAKVKAAQDRAAARNWSLTTQLQYARALLQLGRRDLAAEVIQRAWIKDPDNLEAQAMAHLLQGPSLVSIPALPADPAGDSSDQ